MNFRNSRVYTAPVPKMPPGLVELMEGLARDVLKNNPTDVYTFCAEHMQKLLQIRNGSTAKKLPSLEQKIAIASTKIQERAAQRRKEFDKNFQLISYVKTEKIYDDNVVEADQYIEDNIVKIPENLLVGNTEHEITANVDNSLTTKTISSDIKTNDLKINSYKNDLHNLSIDDKVLAKEILKIGDGKNIRNNKINDDSNIFDNNQITSKVITVNEENTSIYTDNLDKGLSNENIHLESNNDNNIALTSEQLEGDNLNILDVTPAKKANLDSSDAPVLIIDNSDSSIINNNKVDLESDDIDNNVNDDQGSRKTNNEKHNTKDKDSNIDINNADREQQDNKETILETSDSVENKGNPLEKNNIDSQLPNEKNYDENIMIIKEPDGVEIIKYCESHTHGNNSMDLETAAITIQKVFRSFLFRNKTCSIDDATNVDVNLLIEEKEQKDDKDMSNNNINKDRRGTGRMDTVLQTVNEEKSLSLSTDDSSTLSSAATIIQAHVRGFLVRNKFNINKTISSTSGIDSDGQSMTSLEGDNDCRKNKTVLNIHIVPEGGHFMSRDESILTSIDLSLDGSPPGSTNLHPLGYDKSVRRKQLKREDAIQSVSPPSNNSGKLSEDVDSVKEILINDDNDNDNKSDVNNHFINGATSTINALNDDNVATMINDNVENEEIQNTDENIQDDKSKVLSSLRQLESDEMDVITAFELLEETVTPEHNTKLIHSGECHDMVLPTKVSRADASVVREFQNVLVYFLLWNN